MPQWHSDVNFPFCISNDYTIYGVLYSSKSREALKKSNRRTGGYWLRMHAVDQVLNHFLAQSSDNQKIVVNLGCG